MSKLGWAHSRAHIGFKGLSFLLLLYMMKYFTAKTTHVQ